MIAADALQKLRDGNARFVDGDRCIDTYLSHTQLDDHVEGQAPFAVVLGCSDSRVPVEIIFDVGLGDLFVIRVAGNIVAPSLIGSVELATDKFGARLVVVLGHSGCGAVAATIDTLREQENQESLNINSIIDYIRPSVEESLAAGLDGDKDGGLLMKQAVRRNVQTAVADMRHGSGILERIAKDDGLIVVGAEYSLESGVVDFFDTP